MAANYSVIRRMRVQNEGVLIGPNSTNITVVNNAGGDIYGRAAGVFANSHNDGGTIINAGTIRSDDIGISVDTKPGYTTFIYNEPNSTISGGGGGAIYTFNGAISLTNLGTINGYIVCAAPNQSDVIVNNGTINGSVFLFSGNAVYNGKGGGIVTGAVYGGSGSDLFIAGPAKETFFAGSGADSFVFDSIRFSPATAKHDIIQNFSHANGDRIDVHGIDADVTHAGHQHCVFIGAATFAHYHSLHPSAVGMLRFAAASHQLQGTVDGDFVHPDFVVALPGVTAFHASDLILAF
jgi:hypothetical protein